MPGSNFTAPTILLKITGYPLYFSLQESNKNPIWPGGVQKAVKTIFSSGLVVLMPKWLFGAESSEYDGMVLG